MLKTEEKGTDVNLAVHLLNDSWRGRYECAVVVSNDSDLEEAIRIVGEYHKRIIGLVLPSPKRRYANELLRVAKKKGRKLRKRDLIAGVLEEDPTLNPTSVSATISKMVKRRDLVRIKRGKFPLFGLPKEPETTQTEPELQSDESTTLVAV